MGQRGKITNLSNQDTSSFRPQFDYDEHWDKEGQITEMKLMQVNWSSDYFNIVDWTSQEMRDTYFEEKEGGVLPLGDTGYNLRDLMLWNDGMSRYAGELIVDLPADSLNFYNYLAVTFKYPQPVPGPEQREEKFYFFLKSVNNNAPNTSILYLQLDVWTTYKFLVEINGLLLTQGHYPLANLSADEFLANPLNSSLELTADEPDLPRQKKMISSASLISFQKNEARVCIATTANLNDLSKMWVGTQPPSVPDSWWASQDQIGLSGALPTPDATYANNFSSVPSGVNVFSISASNYTAFISKIKKTYPHFIKTIQSIFILDSSLIAESGNITLFNYSLKNVKSQGNAKLMEELALTKELFGYDEKYADFAKLYTSQFSEIIVSSGDKRAAISIEELTGSLKFYARASATFPFLKLEAFLGGVGSDDVKNYSVVPYNTKTAEMFVSQDVELTFDIDVPTFGVFLTPEEEAGITSGGEQYVEKKKNQDTKTYSDRSTNQSFANETRSINVAYDIAENNWTTGYTNSLAANLKASQNAVRDYNTGYSNAVDSATVSRDNSKLSAATSNTNDLANNTTTKTNADLSAATAKTNANSSATTAKTNADAAALTDKTNADNIAETANTNALAANNISKTVITLTDANSYDIENKGINYRYDSTNRIKVYENNVDVENLDLSRYVSRINGEFQEYMAEMNRWAANVGQAIGVQGAVIDAKSQTANSVVGGAVSGVVGGALTGGAVGAVVGGAAGAVMGVSSSAISYGFNVQKLELESRQNQFNYDTATINSLISSGWKDYSFVWNTFLRYEIDPIQYPNVWVLSESGTPLSRLLSDASNTHGNTLRTMKNNYYDSINSAERTYAREIRDLNQNNRLESLKPLDTANSNANRELTTTKAANTLIKSTADSSNLRNKNTADGIATLNKSTADSINALNKTTADATSNRTKTTADTIADDSYDTSIDIADRSKATSTTNVANEKTVSDAIALRSRDTAKDNADLSKAKDTTNSTANKDLGLDINSNNFENDELSRKLGYAQKVATTTSVNGQYSGNALQDELGLRGIEVRVRRISKSDERLVGEAFRAKGYTMSNYYIENPKLSQMSEWTYWKASEIWLSAGQVNDSNENTIYNIFKNGATIWKNPDNTKKIQLPNIPEGVL